MVVPTTEWKQVFQGLYTENMGINIKWEHRKWVHSLVYLLNCLHSINQWIEAGLYNVFHATLFWVITGNHSKVSCSEEFGKFFCNRTYLRPEGTKICCCSPRLGNCAIIPKSDYGKDISSHLFSADCGSISGMDALEWMTAEGHSGLPSWEPRPLLLLPKILLGEKTRAALSWGKATPCLSLIPFLSFFLSFFL